MKIARYADDAGIHHGIVDDGRIIPLVDQPGLDVITVADWPAGHWRKHVNGDTSLDPTLVTLLPPVQPAAFRDYITFEQHLDGVMRSVSADTQIPHAWFDAPAFYFSNPHALVGTGHPVAIPPGCALFDFEVELAAVIGKDGTDLSVAEAGEIIVGYAILNDWSARDLQRPEMTIGLGPAKGKDAATTLGPWLVTPDELAPYHRGGRLALEGSVWVNGELVGRDTFAHMAFSFEEMIAYASRGAQLRRGDIFGSGTMGYGCLAERWGRHGRDAIAALAVGDVVTIELDGIGRIENQIERSRDIHRLPTARRIPLAEWSTPPLARPSADTKPNNGDRGLSAREQPPEPRSIHGI